MENVEKPLIGRRLLLVEDDPLVAMELDEIIRILGAEVVGPFGRVEPALAAVNVTPFPAASLTSGWTATRHFR